MSKAMLFKIFVSTFLIGGLLSVSVAQSANELVEIRLVDNIDDARGYCLDIAGGRGVDAPLDRGLQAHTCYDYTGGLLEDQSFDTNLIERGQFKLPYFNVCMAASSLKAEASLELAPCENVPSQRFSLLDNGRVTLKDNPELCVTVSATEKKGGRGGAPVHVMRPISLQMCKESENIYQSWSIYHP